MFRYLLFADVLGVRVVEVHEGVLEGSDQHGTILIKFLIKNCTLYKKLIFVRMARIHTPVNDIIKSIFKEQLVSIR